MAKFGLKEAFLAISLAATPVVAKETPKKVEPAIPETVIEECLKQARDGVAKFFEQNSSEEDGVIKLYLIQMATHDCLVEKGYAKPGELIELEKPKKEENKAEKKKIKPKEPKQEKK